MAAHSNKDEEDADNNPPCQSQAIIRTRRCKSLRRRDGLIQYAHDTWSQCGEDGILHKIFGSGDGEGADDVMIPPTSDTTTRYLVDVGAWDGKHLSNSHELLFSEQPWRGVLVEADDDKFAKLQQLHAARGNLCVHKTVVIPKHGGRDQANIYNNRNTATLSEILAAARFPGQDNDKSTSLPNDFDFLCIDVDGPDYWLLQDVLTNEWRPKLVVIEFNPTMPNELIYIPPKDDALRHGCSLAALVELMEEYSYILVETTLYNAFFVPTTIYKSNEFQHGLPDGHDTSIEALHETTMGTSLYQLYDGTLKLTGCKKLLWHRLPIEEERIQVLSNKQPAAFPFAPNQSHRKGTKPTKSVEITDPIVNVAAYCQDKGDKSACAKQLIDCLQKDGFVLIKGTGIQRALCEQALQAVNALLQEAPETVCRSAMSTTNRATRGYAPSNTENFAALLGTKNAQNDHVRKFRMGPTMDDNIQHHYPYSSLHQLNVWPSPSRDTMEAVENESDSAGWNVDTCQRFRATCEIYFDAISNASSNVVQAILDGIMTKHPELQSSLEFLSSSDQVVETTRTTSDILTLLGYQVGTRHRKTKRKKNAKDAYPLVAAHTDVGVITVLLFDDGECATLQRKCGTGFKDVLLPPLSDDPVFVVNVADCLSTLTNNILPSTIHRVMPCVYDKDTEAPPSPRNCLALFVGLDPKQELCIPNGEANQMTTYEEWRKQRIRHCQQVMAVRQL